VRCGAVRVRVVGPWTDHTEGGRMCQGSLYEDDVSGVGDLEVFSGEMFWYYPEVWPTAMECTVYWTFDIDWAGD